MPPLAEIHDQGRPRPAEDPGGVLPLPLPLSIARWIRSGIAEGRFAAGQRLIEADLVRATGAGRSTVREGLAQLVSAGVLVAEPHRGVIVRRLTRADVDQIYRVREMLEGLAARQTAERVAQGLVSASAALSPLHAAKRMKAATDVSSFLSHNHEFHACLVAQSANGLLARQLLAAEAPVFQLQFKVLLTPAALRAAVVEHARIAKAVLEGRPRQAEEAMRAHVRHAARLVMALPDRTFGY